MASPKAMQLVHGGVGIPAHVAYLQQSHSASQRIFIQGLGDGELHLKFRSQKSGSHYLFISVVASFLCGNGEDQIGAQ